METSRPDLLERIAADFKIFPICALLGARQVGKTTLERLVKSAKLYIRDSGLLHAMKNIQTYDELILNNNTGASWEGFCLEEISKHLPETSFYFWRTHQESECDVFCIYNNQRIGFEIKLTDQPKITRSMHIAINDLNLDKMYILTPIEESFPLNETIHTLALRDLPTIMKKTHQKN